MVIDNSLKIECFESFLVYATKLFIVQETNIIDARKMTENAVSTK